MQMIESKVSQWYVTTSYFCITSTYTSHLELYIADDGEQGDLPEWPVDSPLYSSDFRDQVTLSKEPDSVLNQRRSQLLVPGSLMPETPQEARLPLLLLMRPPSSDILGESSIKPFHFIFISVLSFKHKFLVCTMKEDLQCQNEAFL